MGGAVGPSHGSPLRQGHSAGLNDHVGCGHRGAPAGPNVRWCAVIDQHAVGAGDVHGGVPLC